MDLKKQKIIFDTDLGDDIDDAYALSLLLCEKKSEIVGVGRREEAGKGRVDAAGRRAFAGERREKAGEKARRLVANGGVLTKFLPFLGKSRRGYCRFPLFMRK